MRSSWLQRVQTTIKGLAMSWDDEQFIVHRISHDVNFHPNGPDISLHRYDRCQPSHYSNLGVTNVLGQEDSGQPLKHRGSPH
jgi:hypothetical protein